MGIDPEAGFALTAPLVPFVFDNSVTATEGRLRTVDTTAGPVGAGAKMGVMRVDGTTVVSPSWDYIGWFCEGLAPVCEGCTRDCAGHADCEHYSIEGGRWGYIDLEGEVVIPLQFDHAATFDGGTAVVRDEGRLGHVHPDGQVEWHDAQSQSARPPSH